MATIETHFSYGWYFSFVQGFVYLILIYLKGFTPKQMVNPCKTYVKLSVVLMDSHGLTKGSLTFLNYPAQIMFKSTKVLPVMIMGAFIPSLRRKYPIHEYISALILITTARKAVTLLLSFLIFTKPSTE